MVVGGMLGILFVTLLRRVMVEDPDLPFPESVAASEIHKAGQQGSKAAVLLFQAMGFGAVLYFLGAMKLYDQSRDFMVRIGTLGLSKVRLGAGATAPAVSAGGFSTISAPAVSPAYLGVGYIIGPQLASLNFSGGVVAWGLLVPLLIYFLGPQLKDLLPPGSESSWGAMNLAVWKFIVRPIAVGGMFVGACYTLFRMRSSLAIGMKRAVSDLKKSGIAGRIHAAHPARSQRQGGIRGTGRDVPVHDRAVLLFCRHAPRGHRGGRGDDHSGILLRRRVGQPGGNDRLLQQPGLGPDAVRP